MHAMRIPSTSLSQSQSMQLRSSEWSARFNEVAFVFSKTGTAEIAADPMPPNVSDTFIILKPREEWPDPSLPKDELIEQIQEARRQAAGQQLRVHAAHPDALQRADRRRARRPGGQGLWRGIRADAASCQPDRHASCAASRAQRTCGSSRSRVCPFSKSSWTMPRSPRLGLSVVAMQDVIAVAIGGREAGVRVRRRPALSTSSCACPMPCATISRRLKQSAGAAADRERNAGGATVGSTEAGRDASLLPKGRTRSPRKRQAAHRGAGQCAGPGHRLASWPRRRQKIAQQVACPRVTGSTGAGSSRISPRRGSA